MESKLLDMLKEAGSVAVSGHVRPDGDCVGSCMGLYHYIKANYPEKETAVYLEPIAESYQVIEDTKDILSEVSPEKRYDLFVALDCGDKERLGFSAACFDLAKKTLCIDHHISNVHFADENIVCPTASSTCEMLCDLMEAEHMNKACAQALYMGIMCDTGCFKHTNTSEHTMACAGALISKGVHTEKMMDEVFYEKTYLQNKLLGRCLLDSELWLDGRVIVSKVSQVLLKQFDAKPSDLEGVIDQLRLTKGTETAILLTENEDGGWKLSMRSKDRVNVAEIAVAFGGGGHIKAAGATLCGEVGVLLDEIIKRIGAQLNNDDRRND